MAKSDDFKPTSVLQVRVQELLMFPSYPFSVEGCPFLHDGIDELTVDKIPEFLPDHCFGCGSPVTYKSTLYFNIMPGPHSCACGKVDEASGNAWPLNSDGSYAHSKERCTILGESGKPAVVIHRVEPSSVRPFPDKEN